MEYVHVTFNFNYVLLIAVRGTKIDFLHLINQIEVKEVSVGF